MNDDLTVFASPTKEFFIYMITRDIETQAAIAELIDNSVDGAKRTREDGDYSGIEINLEFDKNHFIIRDNCGGIDIDTAKYYAFRFGRDKTRQWQEGFYTGLFGIGMKRALFKLGKKFTITSTTTKSRFELEVDVDKWVDKDEWEFEFKSVEKDRVFKESECGTIIEITNLNPEQAVAFSDQIIKNQLLSYLEKYRSSETEKGMVITINNQSVNNNVEYLIENDNVHSYISNIKDDDGDIKIIAGITKKGKPEKAGWYIYCNGRLILYADRTAATGWGERYRIYHNELAMFRGYVFFNSTDLLMLPWNTTKTGVDVSNRLYSIALDKMTEAVKQISAEIRKIKDLYDVEEVDSIFEESYIKQIAVNSIFETMESNSSFEINLKELPVKKKRISFSVPEDKYKLIQDRLNVKSAKQLGEKIFEYYCDMEGI